ncbi:ABC transporter ATP-binding protein [Paenibacillus sp. YSY-4.3]
MFLKKRESELYKKNLRYVKPYWLPLSIVVAIMVVEVIFTLFVAKYQEFFINGIHEKDMNTINYMVILAVPLGLSLIVIRFFQNYIRYYYHGLHIRDLSFQVLGKINRFKLPYLRKRSISDYVTRATGDVGQTANMVENATIEIIFSALVILCSCFYLKDVDLVFTIAALSSGPIIYMIGRLFDKRIKKMSVLIQQKQALVRGIVQEGIQGLETIKVYNLQEHYHRKYIAEKSELNSLVLKRKMTAKAMEEAINVFTNSFIIAIVFFICLSTIDGKLSIGSVMSSIYLLLRIQSAYATVSTSIGELQVGLASAERVFEIIDEEEQLERPSDAESDDDPLSEVLAPAIHMKNVGYSYLTSNGESKVLNELSVCLWPGEKVGLIGESGNGKSTLARLLLGFYDNYSGSIHVMGREVKEHVNGVRDSIAYVPQDILLLPGSIRDNILLGSEHKSEEEMIEAAVIACAHPFIMELPNGYDTLIGELGNSLSGGQIQRICLARALLKDSTILILDEPTSSLDEHNEALIVQGVFEKLKDKTVIFITHHVHSLQKADRVLVIEQGTIVEKQYEFINS